MSRLALRLQYPDRQGLLSWLRAPDEPVGSRARIRQNRSAGAIPAPGEAEVWKIIDKAQEEWQKLATLQGELTGYHKPKLTPEQKAAIEKGEEQISRKAQPALQRLKEIEVARWQNAWIPVALRLTDEDLSDAQLAAIDQSSTSTRGRARR